MKGYMYSQQGTLFGERKVVGFGDDEFWVSQIDRDLANDLIVKNHYSKKYYSASYIHLGIFTEKEDLVGVLQYGYAMNPASQGGVVTGTPIDCYLELNRMWIDDKIGKNAESKAISYSLKFIKAAYPKIRWVQSFADERCNLLGVVYQAANFLYCGYHETTFWELDDKFYHKSLMERNPRLSRSARYLQDNKERAKPHLYRQFRYIYFLKKKYRNDLLLRVLEYPKWAAEVSREKQPATSRQGGGQSPDAAFVNLGFPC